MQEFFKQTRVMETETIQKNGASLKSRKRVGFNFKSFAMLVFVLSAFVFAGCEKDEEKDDLIDAILQQQYFTIQNGTLHKGTVPSSVSGISIADDIVINSNAITGGSSFVSIASEQQISEIYVGVEGVDYYYSVIPQSPPQETLRATQSSANNYSLVILFSQNLEESFTIQVSAKLGDGSLTSIYTTNIKHIAAGTGSLQVSLSFDNEKDIDLYVVQPDGEIIFYGNPGNYYEKDGEIQGWGLDIDSNAACDIDGINNENVFYSNEYIQSGKYEVWINMYANCNEYISTNWIVTALYEGALVTTTYGRNPEYGVFSVNTPSNPISNSLDGATKVMEFTLSGRVGQSRVSINNKTPNPLTESAKIKLFNIKK